MDRNPSFFSILGPIFKALIVRQKEEWKTSRHEGDLGSVWIEEWKSEKMENCGRIEKWEDGKYLVFPLMCLVGGVEKWKDGKLFCLVGEKKERMENVIYINWLLYPCYIICKK